MRNIWLFIFPPIILAVLCFVAWIRYREKSKKRVLKKSALIAHTRTIKMLPAYKKAAKKYRTLMIVAIASFIVLLFGITGLVARPVQQQIREHEEYNRDIMLCLDVSGSMESYVDEILDYITLISESLRGQRVGITIFNGLSATVIPLSDDYFAITDIIDDIKKNYSSYTTVVAGKQASLIGDGTLNCISALGLNDNAEGRSKSVILLTDNYLGGGPDSTTISQAAEYAARHGVTIYGISTGSDGEWPEAKQYKSAVLYTGGSYYNVSKYSDKKQPVNDVVKNIFEQEAAKAAGAPELINTDAPQIAAFVTLISFAALMVVIWRLKI